MLVSVVIILSLSILTGGVDFFKLSPDTEERLDMGKYLDDTRDLVQSKKYEEALERFIWFHNHALEHESAMVGVRLSFALADWKELGDVYPPALEAFIKMRDDKTATMVSGKGDVFLFMDVQALNRELEEDNKTIELFKTLDQEQKFLAYQCWRMVKDVAIKAKEYDLVKKYIKSFKRDFREILSRHHELKSRYEKGNYDTEYFEMNDDWFVEGIVLLLDAAIGVGNIDDAKQIQAEALTVVDDDRIRNVTIEDTSDTPLETDSP